MSGSALQADFDAFCRIIESAPNCFVNGFARELGLAAISTDAGAVQARAALKESAADWETCGEINKLMLKKVVEFRRYAVNWAQRYHGCSAAAQRRFLELHSDMPCTSGTSDTEQLIHYVCEHGDEKLLVQQWHVADPLDSMPVLVYIDHVAAQRGVFVRNRDRLDDASRAFDAIPSSGYMKLTDFEVDDNSFEADVPDFVRCHIMPRIARNNNADFGMGLYSSSTRTTEPSLALS